MSDYRRSVYYLYNYENGRKRNNIGFARVEQMNGKCKLMTRIRVPSMNGKTLDVCLFIREQGEMRFLFLGKMQIRNMTGEFRIILEEDNIMGMGYSLKEMKGMVIYESLQKFFGSEWDDGQIFFEEFKFAGEKKKSKEEGNLMENIHTAYRETSEEDVNAIWPLSREMADSSDRESAPDSMLLTASSAGEIVCPNYAEREGDVICEGNKEKNICRKSEEEMDICRKDEFKGKEIMAETKLSGQKEEIGQFQQKEYLPDVFYQFPQMHPFEDDEITDCVRIEPQDIGRLPMESWILANNSFLLHSYYSYRHLLLARRKNNNSGFEYILCAPGICQNREQFMAAMFGFSDFKPARNVKDKNGEFGYWYMPVIIQN